ncbi:fructosamine kinase family protein [Sagittula stellata]|uniref:Fructosamine-3-kinase n=1 Tax=Sagittula stellata (strain ATCC 700073 / DSM 11524 / E-37) TaxID=388399 RepID=A3KAJ0_SAGS3|nr:fructosamine kinase family protein [Sagittula stellata]EBA05849.1 fructosamine-3-kinase [Sagittula stellata E-37]
MISGPYLAAALETPVTAIRHLHGGDLSEVACVDLADGRRMAVKVGAHVGVEARMLQAMDRSGAPVPRVLFQGRDVLCLEWLEEGPATEDGWHALGRGLRRLHATTGDDTGWPEGYAFGALRLDMAPRPDWPSFWCEARLLPLLPHLPGPVARRVETLASALPDRLEDVTPVLLHGDLWTGNAVFSGDRAWMIDPACYFGDPEVDLAMLHLFGKPDHAFHDGYGALRKGHEARRPIYQLFPALVHLHLFGGSYYGLVERLLTAARV